MGEALPCAQLDCPHTLAVIVAEHPVVDPDEILDRNRENLIFTPWVTCRQ